MKRLWFVRGYRKGDEYGMAKLMKLEYGGSEDYWRKLWIWECIRNPIGHLTTVAEYNGQIVGKMSLVLVRMKIGTETLIGSQAVDLVVHPSFRRQGMFMAIGKHLLDEAGKRGIFVSYGFPNKPARAGHLKYGWFDVCNVPVFIKFLDIYNALCWYTNNKYGLIKVLNRYVFSRLVIKCILRIIATVLNLFFTLFRGHISSDIIEKVKITRAFRFDQRFDEFWNDVSRINKIVVVRDSDYLNWRYFEKPNSNYIIFVAEKNNKVLGYIVLRLKKISGIIIDMLAYPDKRVMRSLLLKATDFFKCRKVSWITCSILPNDVYYKALKESGFIPVPSDNPLIARVNIPKISQAFVKDPRNWHITAGDSVNRIA